MSFVGVLVAKSEMNNGIAHVSGGLYGVHKNEIIPQTKSWFEDFEMHYRI